MSTGLSSIKKTNFFIFPSTKAKLTHQLNSSQLLLALWHKHPAFSEDNDTLNSPSTLPLDIKPKAELYNEVAILNPNKEGIALKFKQSVFYGKTLMKFYKAGVSNVWNNKKELNSLIKKQFKLVNQLSNNGKEINIKIPSFSKLTSEMSQAIYISQIENKTFNDSTRGNIIRKGKPERSVDTNLFNLSRHQYQLIKRTPSDLWKLPMFAIIFMVFVECTPLLCYAIPEITPSTCVLPSILPRIWNPTATIKLKDLRKGLKGDELEGLATKNAYNLSLKEVRLLSKALRLTSKYIPVSIYPESYLRHRLQQYYNYLKVDNYLLSGLNGESSGNIWNLSNQELLRAALERNLILDIKNDIKNFNQIKDESLKTSKEQKYFNELRLKLFHFIVDFENFNIGYLGINHLINDPVDTEILRKWWKEDNPK